ncbi:tetracycline resistance protein transposon [Magnaporthiopsis poae ATCC 64411]|uniref:Tetracycline resistance protein transposon n=1 Tax=Magnaporthiopsis poae (strain ATCC 64411 / 73-15) TaxID=644358 RepID=A0A0C4EEU0_MAGP6|nr:tetracycline resistance protein transposon [Magnaporthiopsis poae ATCC 64411]
METGLFEVFEKLAGTTASTCSLSWNRPRAAAPAGNWPAPAFAGLDMYDMSIPDPEARMPELYLRDRRGSTFACAEGWRVTSQQMGEGVNLSFDEAMQLSSADPTRRHLAGSNTYWSVLTAQ